MNRYSEKYSELKRIVNEPILLGTIVFIIFFLLIFILYPLVKVIYESMLVQGKLSLAVYLKVLSRYYYIKPLFNSILLGSITAIIGTVIGFIFAYAITRTDIPFKMFFRITATFPIVSPPFMISIAAIMLLGNNGLISKKLLDGALPFSIYGLWGLVIVEVLTYGPTALLVLMGVLSHIDPGLEESAQDLGASKWKVFTTITLPLSAPGITSSLLLIFIESLADFGNPMVLSGDFHVLSVQAYLQITGMFDIPRGAVLSVFLLIPSIAAFIIQKYYISKKFYITVTGKPTAATLKATEKHIKIPVLILCLMISVVIFLFYGTVIAGSFVKLWGANNTLTLSNYAVVFYAPAGKVNLPWKYLKDTLTLTAIATPITGILGMIIAYLIVRKKFIGRWFIEITSLLTFAVPGTVVGIGYILAFNEKHRIFPYILSELIFVVFLVSIFQIIKDTKKKALIGIFLQMGILALFLKIPTENIFGQGKMIYGQITYTALIIIVLFIFRNMPVGIQSGVAALQQIDPAIEEASTNLGAGSGTTFRKITLPLITPAFFSGLAYSFVRCMTAISAIIFVVSGNWNHITVNILGLVENSDLSQAAAVCMVLIVLILLALGAIQLFVTRVKTGQRGFVDLTTVSH